MQLCIVFQELVIYCHIDSSSEHSHVGVVTSMFDGWPGSSWVCFIIGVELKNLPTDQVRPSVNLAPAKSWEAKKAGILPTK